MDFERPATFDATGSATHIGIVRRAFSECTKRAPSKPTYFGMSRCVNSPHHPGRSGIKKSSIPYPSELLSVWPIHSQLCFPSFQRSGRRAASSRPNLGPRQDPQVACIGSWHPARVSFQVPRSGQRGYHHRTAPRNGTHRTARAEPDMGGFAI